MENSPSSVVVKLELGHHASVRSEKTPEGFTHDWTVFVRGPEGPLQHFVDKVIFYLHESFHKPKRVVKEPPYQVSESGYAGFILPIEVYFKNKEEPKKVRFEYDLYLRVTGPPINNIRCEKLTFQNPVDDFRRKLVKGGGVAATLVSSDNNGNVASVQTHSTTLGQDKSDHSSDSQKLTGSKISSFRSQDKKKHSSIKEGTKTLQSYSSGAYIPGASQPFTHIFGTPIKTKPSPEQAGKQKEGSAAIQSNQKIGSGHTKPSKTSSSHPSNNSQPSTKEKVGRPAKEKSPHDKESKDTKHTKHLKHPEKESKQLSVKRQSSPSHASERKRKRTTSTSSESNSAAPQPASSAEKKGDTPKSKHKEVKVKEKHKAKQANSADNGNSSAHRKEKSKDKSKTSKKLAVENNVSPLHQGNQRTNDTHTDGNSAQSMQPEEKVDVSLVETKEDSVLQAEDLNSSPSSSISLSSLPPVGSHGPLATMMAEMEKDLLSPLSSEPGSHSLSNSPILKDKSEDNHAGNSDAGVSQNMVIEQVNKEALEEELFGKVKDESESVKDKKDDIEQGNKLKKDQTSSIKKKRDEVDGRSHEEMTSKSSVRGGKLDDKVSDKDRKRILQFDQVYINELIDLQRKIMALRDRHIIQKIVNVIEESGNFDVTKTSLDFDLCRLDQMTVRKLQNCLAVK